MIPFFAGLSLLGKIFLVSALIGIFGFLVQLLLQVFGIDELFDIDGLDGDFDHFSPDFGFKVLSIQGFTAFFVMFGLVGLSLEKSFPGKSIASILGAVLAGYFSIYLFKYIYWQIFKLQSSGNLKIDSAIGAEGIVYLTIPANGEGVVQVPTGNRYLTLPAYNEAIDEELPTSTRVLVVGTIRHTALKVKRIS